MCCSYAYSVDNVVPMSTMSSSSSSWRWNEILYTMVLEILQISIHDFNEMWLLLGHTSFTQGKSTLWETFTKINYINYINVHWMIPHRKLNYLIGQNFGGQNCRNSDWLPKILSAEKFCLPKIFSAEKFCPLKYKTCQINTHFILKHSFLWIVCRKR